MSKTWEELRAELVRDLGRILLKTGALQFGTFKLSSGKLSSYYIDLRLVPSYPGVFRKVISAYIGLIRNEVGSRRVDAVAGIPTAGLPYASVVAYTLRKPLVYVRREEKAHGAQRLIEGTLSPGWRVAILDDLITTGSTIIKVADVVRREGGVVQDAVVLIDRREGGAERLKEAGIRLTSLTAIDELTQLLYEADLIDEEQRRAILQQLAEK